jgi:hypothetical protein
MAAADTPTAHWSFLYTGFIAAVYGVFGFHPLAVRVISAVAGGILLPYSIFRLTRRVLPNREGIALITAGSSAVYAYFILYAALLMTETFFIIAIVWSLERLLLIEYQVRNRIGVSRKTIVGFGISLGIATLLRQSILPWLFILSAWLLWVGWRNKSVRTAVLSVFVSVLIVMLFIIPFTIRNYLVYDGFLLLNSNTGYAMYSAQHPMHGTNFQAFSAAPLPSDIEPVPENEARWDRVLMQRGIKFIIDEPGRYVLLSFSRVADYFMFWPSSESTLINNIGRVASFGLFLPFIIHGLVLSFSNWRRFRALYLFIISYSLIHLLTWSMIRYRLPIDAVLLIFASLSIGWFATQVRLVSQWKKAPK